MAIARHRTSRQTRWLARQSHRYVAATTVCTSTWTLEPTTTTRAPFLSLSESPDLIGRFWSALPFLHSMAKICPILLMTWAGIEKNALSCRWARSSVILRLSRGRDVFSTTWGSRGCFFAHFYLLQNSLICCFPLRWTVCVLLCHCFCCFSDLLNPQTSVLVQLLKT